MNLFIDRHQQVISVLIRNEVEFIIIGGYSVIFHGYKRTTGDVDIWINPDNKNRNKLIPALKELDISEESIKMLSNLDFSKHLAFYLWKEPERIDFLTYINSVTFEEANEHKIVADIDGLKVPFLHINHLILSKMSTGRIKDKADIEELQKIIRLMKDPE
ncbi:MAG: nucleotidyltransferase [Flavobacteriales bacterium]|nr:nucleotidyltransferase [Flavobacteriales bacterium]